MAKILLIDIDSKWDNLALEKIRCYHESKGDEVLWNMPIFMQSVDKTYVSCIWTKNRDQCLQYEGLAEIGGSGYDLSVALPPEIETVKPHINLGLTSRGCIRRCEFCVVYEKEGDFYVVGDLLDLWDAKSGLVTVLDNNILADKDHTAMICQQAADNGIKIDFSSGLDHRLLDKAILKQIAPIHDGFIRFAFDNPRHESSVFKALKMMHEVGIKIGYWYVLVGFNTTFWEDYNRVMFLKGYHQGIYIMRYNECSPILARWVNNQRVFYATTFREYMQSPQMRKYVENHRPAVEAYMGDALCKLNL